MKKNQTRKKPLKKQAPKKASAKKKKAGAQLKAKAGTTFKAYQTHLKAGDSAPDFEGPDQSGKTVSLHDFTGKKVILYFYPKDDTPACTATACSLRDEYQFLSQKNYQVVGVSADSVKSHAKFSKKFGLPFPIIADEQMKIINAYDVWGQKMLFGRIYDGIVRTTFIIDENGVLERVITAVDTAGHGQQVMEPHIFNKNLPE